MQGSKHALLGAFQKALPLDPPSPSDSLHQNSKTRNSIPPASARRLAHRQYPAMLQRMLLWDDLDPTDEDQDMASPPEFSAKLHSQIPRFYDSTVRGTSTNRKLCVKFLVQIIDDF